MSTDPHALWADALDQLEKTLDFQQAQLAAASAAGELSNDVVTFTPPADLPPIPQAFVERARALAERNAELLKLAENLAAPRRAQHTPAEPRTARSFDTKA